MINIKWNRFQAITKLPKKLSYSLRFPVNECATYYYDLEKSYCHTEQLIPLNTFDKSLKLWKEKYDYNQHYEGEFSTIQNSIAKQFIKMINSSVQMPEIQLQRFPLPPSPSEEFLDSLQWVAPLIFLISFLFPFISIVRSISSEKQSNQAMDLQIWFSLLARSMIMLILSMVGIVILLKVRFSTSECLNRNEISFFFEWTESLVRRYHTYLHKFEYCVPIHILHMLFCMHNNVRFANQCIISYSENGNICFFLCMEFIDNSVLFDTITIQRASWLDQDFELYLPKYQPGIWFDVHHTTWDSWTRFDLVSIFQTSNCLWYIIGGNNLCYNVMLFNDVPWRCYVSKEKNPEYQWNHTDTNGWNSKSCAWASSFDIDTWWTTFRWSPIQRLN